MPKLTITEALAEIKTTRARIEKKYESVAKYAARDARLKDPMESDGGSDAFVIKERQAAADLETRIVNIRTAIQATNIVNVLEIDGKTKSVAQWLNWRREIAPRHKSFLSQLAAGIDRIRKDATQKGLPVTTDGNASGETVIIHVNEKRLTEEIEAMEKVLGDLDGRLSLFNATSAIDVP